MLKQKLLLKPQHLKGNLREPGAFYKNLLFLHHAGGVRGPQNAGNARDGILHVGGRASRESIVGSPRAGKMNSKYVFKWILTVWKSAGVT